MKLLVSGKHLYHGLIKVIRIAIKLMEKQLLYLGTNINKGGGGGQLEDGGPAEGQPR